VEAQAASERAPNSGLPQWALGLLPVALIIVAAALFAALGAPGLGERLGPPAEDLEVERTVLRPGVIELTVRNDGLDPVRIEQVIISDAFVPFESESTEIGRLGAERLTIPYPWIEGEAYEMALLLDTGGTIDHEIELAVETPASDAGFFGLMALIGLYVGIIPVSIGMLWLPFVRRARQEWLRGLIAFTVGLLAFLAVDAALEGLEIGGEGPQVFGGAALVVFGAIVAYLLLAGIDSHLRSRHERATTRGASGAYLALLVAIGIGLHNLGEGLAIGSAYATGALALGAFLIVGFALHNTTEGLAIVAPLGDSRPKLSRLFGFGVIAGAPVILGAWIGASAFNNSIVAFLLGVGVGAIVQVIQQLTPMMRDESGRALNPTAVIGVLIGLVVLYVTGLLIAL
jgi:ZIP family zinc transporter